jgi:hypothetical protein
MAEILKYCPACDKEYPNWIALIEHLKKAEAEGHSFHIEIIRLEGWDELFPLLEKAPVDPQELT